MEDRRSSGVALREGGFKPPHAALAEDFVNMSGAGLVEPGRRCCTSRWRSFWTSGVALREEASNHLPGPWLKTVVLNGAGKGATRSRQVRAGKMSDGLRVPGRRPRARKLPPRRRREGEPEPGVPRGALSTVAERARAPGWHHHQSQDHPARPPVGRARRKTERPGPRRSSSPACSPVSALDDDGRPVIPAPPPTRRRCSSITASSSGCRSPAAGSTTPPRRRGDDSPAARSLCRAAATVRRFGPLQVRLKWGSARPR